MYSTQTALARTTASLTGQSVCARYPDTAPDLALNPHLHAQVALSLLANKPALEVACRIARSPIAHEAQVRTALEKDSRGKVRAHLVHAYGVDERMFALLQSSSSRKGLVDHALLHHLESMPVTVSDALALSGTHAFAFAAALREGSTLTVEDMRLALQSDSVATARSFVAPLLAKFPDLAADVARHEPYRSSLASSTALLGRAALAEELAQLALLSQKKDDWTWLEANKYLYFALLANPFTPASLVVKVNETAPRLREDSFGKAREHAQTLEYSSVCQIDDPELVDWLLKRAWPDPRYEGKLRAHDLPDIAQAPGLSESAARTVISRTSVYYQPGQAVEAAPFASAAVLRALTTLAQRFPELAGEVSEVSALVAQAHTSWTRCHHDCEIVAPMPVPRCPGCSDDMSIDSGLGLTWSVGGQRAHTHALDESWDEDAQAWMLGFELLTAFQGTFLQLRDLVHDSVA